MGSPKVYDHVLPAPSIGPDGHLENLPQDMSPTRKRELTTAWASYRWAWWSLSPQLQHMLNGDAADNARGVVKAMLDCIGMRRGMDTITELPDHDNGDPWMVCPRDGIPPHQVETHELGYGLLADKVVSCMDEHFQDLTTADDGDAVTEDTILAEDRVGSHVVAAVHDPKSDESGGRMDPGLMHILTIASMCQLSYDAMLTRDELGSTTQEEAELDLAAANELTSLPKKKHKSAR